MGHLQPYRKRHLRTGGLQLIAIVPFQTLAARVLGAFVAAGLAIGACGSLMAIRKFLQV
ncbi:MAG: hypothetical protein ACLSAF_01110 [Intestinimonas sp.]